jgi:hypothetical protein
VNRIGRPSALYLQAFALACTLVLTGCSGGWGPRGPAALVEIADPIPIPAGSAHTDFQDGRQRAGVSWERPYCELEIETVAETAQEARPGRYRVTAERRVLLKDPITREPALLFGVGCWGDPLYWETLWLLGGDTGGNVHSLRCIRPGFHCRIPPPMTLADVPGTTGSAIAVALEHTPATP